MQAVVRQDLDVCSRSDHDHPTLDVQVQPTTAYEPCNQGSRLSLSHKSQTLQHEATFPSAEFP